MRQPVQSSSESKPILNQTDTRWINKYEMISQLSVAVSTIFAFIAILLAITQSSIVGEHEIGGGVESIQTDFFGRGTSSWTKGDETFTRDITWYEWTDQYGNPSMFAPSSVMWLLGLLILLNAGSKTLKSHWEGRKSQWEYVSFHSFRFQRVIGSIFIIVGEILWFRNLERTTSTRDVTLDWIKISVYHQILTFLSIIIAILMSLTVILSLKTPE